MKILHKIIKLFAFIIIIKASFLVSFAFVGDDLGLNLYKQIDKGTTKLNSTMYSHELKGGDINGNITDYINKKIKKAGLKGCELENITQQDIEEIAYGEKDNVEKSPNLGLLKQKIKGDKCDNSVETLNKLQSIIYNTSRQSFKSAKEKADDIYNISKIGLFSDGNVQNSPFDIVQDIKDIDYIIFTQEIDYGGDIGMGDELINKYLEGKKLGKFLKGDLLEEIYQDAENKANNELDKVEDKINNEINKLKDKILNNSDKNGYIQTGGDDTKYICPPGEDESGLSPEDLTDIINSSNGNSNLNKGSINSNYIERSPLSDNPFSFSTSGNYSIGGEIGSTIQTKPYIAVNDNKFFGGCETFFCITVDFLTHDGNLLIGGKTRSIESIVERSNNHLKKFANSSLVQSKMTKNLFELGLRDIDLSSMFSMPMVIIKKTPPILNLDFYNNKVASEKKKKEKNKDPNPFSRQNLLKARFDAVGINIERENDLSIFEDRDAEIKTVINNAELGLSQINENEVIRREQKSKMLLLDAHIRKIVIGNYQSGDTDGLYKEFVELERFSSEIQNYVNAGAKSADKMLAIPIHP